MIRDKLVITLGNFIHECLKLADFIGMGILLTFLGMCVFG